MKSYEIQHLVEVLLRHRVKLKTWGKVARAIEKANNFDESLKIDRRTLARICEETDAVQLKLGHLLAIDRWLRLENEGELLARHRSLIDSIRESYNVNILVACTASPNSRYEVISRWDLRASTRLLRTPINSLYVRIWDIKGPENWRYDDTRIINAANISIASPVASYASQAIMSKMIGLAPDAQTDLEALPFYIVGCDRDESIDRNFVRKRSEMASTAYAGLLPDDPDKRALVIGGKWYVSTDDTDYALLLAQRNPGNGHVQMVLCGLIGPSTYKLARIIQAGQPSETLPALKSGDKRPPIFMALYKLPQGSDNAKGGRNGLGALDWSIVDSPGFIHYKAKKWQFQE
jgi:hypothetical protein